MSNSPIDEPTVAVTGNVFVENDVYNLPKDSKLGELALGAAAWIVGGRTPAAAHLVCLRRAVRAVRSLMPDYAVWLLAGHAYWQPDNRIVGYRRLWESLRAGEVPVPEGPRTGEHAVSGAEGVRWFGAIALSENGLEAARAIMAAQPGSLVVALRRGDEAVVTEAVEGGWSRPAIGPAPELLRSICGVEGIVLWPVGAFDDREAGVVAFAKPDLARQMAA